MFKRILFAVLAIAVVGLTLTTIFGDETTAQALKKYSLLGKRLSVDDSCYVDGVYKGNANTRGTNTFTTTAAADTVVISGVTTASIFVVSAKHTAAADTSDILTWEARTDTLFVRRNTGGTSGLGYSYIRFE